MGLFKIFSSKKLSENAAIDIKAQAYDATTASLPPLLGTYPVAGNGPTNVFEDLQRSHHKMSETSLSLTAGSDASAPAPIVPRFRDASVERPGSVPIGARPSSSSPPSHGRRDSAKGPPASNRKPQVGSVTSAGSPAPRRVSPSPAIPLESEPPHPPTAPFAHSRHFSMQSNGSLARNFIDILDAQSEIKPSGFQKRVKAAGVRDYGEDVADRNIGENGVDLTSEKVKAFYATNVDSSPRDGHDGAPAPSVSRAQFGDKKQPFKPPQRHESLDSEAQARTQSLTSPNVGGVPFRTTILSTEWSQRPETIIEDVPQSARSRRRQSLGSYSLGSLIPTTPSMASLGVHASPDTTTSPSTRRQKRRSTTSGEAPPNLGIYTPQSNESPKSPQMSQKPVYDVKHNYSLLVQQRPKTSGHVYAETYQAVRPPSRGGSVTNSTFFPSPSKRHTLSATGRPSLHRTEWSRGVKTDGGLGVSRGRVGRVEVENYVESEDVSSPAPSPHVTRSGHLWREAQNERERIQSHESPPGKINLDEICGHVPMRTSSPRHWSISSATPTLSSSSSFPRPLSRHTATTSVDLATMSSFMNDSCDSLHSETGDHASFCTALNSALSFPLDSATPGAGFNIDDYLSSDDDVDADSFITTRRRDSGLGATNEEELLFSDNGYGEDGLQLPGLFDSLTSVPDATFSSSSSSSRLSMRPSHGNPVGFQQRLSLDPRMDTPIFPLDEEDYEPGDYDILPARADLALGRRGSRRISAIGVVYQRIEEEIEEKVDARTAMRLRKEAKARQRAMMRLNLVQKRRAVTDKKAHHINME